MLSRATASDKLSHGNPINYTIQSVCLLGTIIRYLPVRNVTSCRYQYPQPTSKLLTGRSVRVETMNSVRLLKD